MREVRTKQDKLLICKTQYSENGQILMEIKNGKKTERILLQEFLESVCETMGISISKLNIVTK